MNLLPLFSFMGSPSQPPLAQVFKTEPNLLPKSVLVPDFYSETYHVCVLLYDIDNLSEHLHWIYDLPTFEVCLQVIDAYYPDITCQHPMLSTETGDNSQ